MKSKLTMVGGLCAALLSQTAFAWVPGVDTPDVTLLLSGATASENGIKNLLQGSLCLNNGNTDVFQGTNQKVVFCDMDDTTVPGLGSTKKVLVRKSGVGGSGNGVGPVCNATPLTNGFMVVTTGSGGACTETSPGQWSCSGFSTETLTPEVGISDVAPNEVFSGASTGCGANVFGSYETIFGIPVTTALRDALQEAQGLTIGADDEANMPSMTSETFASIMTGRVQRWSNLLAANGTPLTAAVSSPPADTRVTICRRVDTSGTFASQNIRMLQRSCVAGALAAAAVNAFPADTNGPVVVGPLSGAGNVDACLNDYNASGAYLGRAGSTWAIGHQSTDRDPTDTGLGYRFIKLNGVAPTFENVANGSYKYSVTSTIQWKSLAGDKLLIAQRIQTDSATPTEIGAVRVQHPWGNSGLMALAENGFNVTYNAGVYDDTKPVTPFTHKTTTLSNCIDPVRVTGKSVPIE